MEEFKINNNISFEDEETKIEYQKYLDEINEYNRKVANGETLEKDLSTITEEFKQKFNVNGSETNPVEDKNLDELIEKLNKSLDSKYTNTNLSIDEQIENIDKRIEELNKQEDVNDQFIIYEMVFPFLFLYDKINLVSKFITYYHLLARELLDLLLTGTLKDLFELEIVRFFYYSFTIQLNLLQIFFTIQAIINIEK